MENIRKYIAILALILVLGFTSCENDFDKINENPNAVLNASTPALFTQAIRDIAYNDFDVWYIGRQSGVAAQHTSQRNYTSEDRYSFRSGTTDGFFRNNYIYMNNLQQIINLNTDPESKDNYATLYGDNGMQIAVAEIMKAWTFQLLTDYFGDIPYSQALDIEQYPQPVYDNQKDVYDGLIAKLNEAQDLLNAASSGFESGDVIYGGDLEKWVKFANSLRLRLALRASNADVAYLTEAADAIADGVFESNEDNAAFSFSASGTPNEAPWYNGFYVAARNDFTFTARFMETLKGNNHLSYVNPFNGLFDPRYPVYTTKTATTWQGVPYGMSDILTQQWWSGNGATRVSLDHVGPVFLDADFPSTFLDYATVCFMAAEVDGLDVAWYESGIRASFEQWGAIDEGDAYVTEAVTRFNAASDAVKKEMIITQKYLHLLMQSHEAWAEYRRTGYPALIKPGDVTAVIDGEDVLFTPVSGSESGSDVVARFKYPTSEFTLNKANVEAAVARMGEDTHKQRVWWDGGGLQ